VLYRLCELILSIAAAHDNVGAQDTRARGLISFGVRLNQAEGLRVEKLQDDWIIKNFGGVINQLMGGAD